MAYRWFFGDLRTGKISRSIDGSGTWSTSFDTADTLDFPFPLRSINEATGEYEWRFARGDSAPARQYMAVAWVDDDEGVEEFIAGGPIWVRRYDRASAQLQLTGAGLWSIFDRRLVMRALAAGANPAEGSRSYSARWLSLIAKRLLQDATTYMAGAELPIVFPDDASLGGSGSNHERNYPGYELGFVGERLRQLTEVQGGPEVQFMPRRRADDRRYLEWVLRIGTPTTSMMLHQSGAPWVLDERVEESPIVDISIDEDGSQMASRAFAAGQGEAEGTPIAWGRNEQLVNEFGYPALDATVSTPTDTVSNMTTLQRHVASHLAWSDRPWETWDVEVDEQSFWRIAPSFRPGDWVRLEASGGDPYIVPGRYEMRALSASGGQGAVTISMSPRKAAI